MKPIAPRRPLPVARRAALRRAFEIERVPTTQSPLRELLAKVQHAAQQLWELVVKLALMAGGDELS